MYDDLAPALVVEAQKENDGTDVDLTKVTPELVAIIKAMLFPDYVQRQTEHVLDETVPYFFGREDHFEIIIPLQERF